MTSVKIFNGNTTASLESSIQLWLEQNPGVKITHVQYSHVIVNTHDGYVMRYSALFLYAS